MTSLPLVLVLVSALIHAGWNVVVKQSKDKLLFTWLFVTGAVVIYTPLAVWSVVDGARLSWPGMICVAATSVAYGGYFTLLAQSYRHGDVSLSYPIARAVAPLATALWGVALLGEHPSPTGMAGIALVVIAGALLGLPQDLLGRWLSRKHAEAGEGSQAVRAAILCAVGTGLFSSAYSAIDKVGVSLVNPVLYIYLTFAGSVVTLLPVVWRRYRVGDVVGMCRSAPKQIVWAGLGSMGGYLLVLFAMQQAPVSYVVPLRSTSILFTVLLGGWALREGKLLLRLPLAITIVAGVVLIAWQG